MLPHRRRSPALFLPSLLCSSKLHSPRGGAALRLRPPAFEEALLVAENPIRPPVSKAIVGRLLSRLGLWESSVERPHRGVPNQQLELPPSKLSTFTVRQDQPEQILRFQGCQAERQFWLDTLHQIEPDGRRVTRFDQCGGFAHVAEDPETGRLFLQAETCKLRICPVCRRRIQAKAAARVLHFMNQRPGEKWQFQTFTLKHSARPLHEQLDRLVRSFRKLRQRKLWRTHVVTGYAVIEVQFNPVGTYSPNGRLRTFDEWHPHLHVVARTDFIPWGPLRKAWLEVTGDSDNIDCEPCESATHAATYVAKYIGKPADLALTNNNKRAAEYYYSLKSRRLLMPFGDTAKHRPPPPPPAPPSKRIVRFSTLLWLAKAGNDDARALIAELMTQTLPRSVLGLDTEAGQQLLLFDRSPP